MKKCRKSDEMDDNADSNRYAESICSNTKKLRIGNDEIDYHWKHIAPPHHIHANANANLPVSSMGSASDTDDFTAGATSTATSNNKYVYVNSILKEMHLYRQIRHSTIPNPMEMVGSASATAKPVPAADVSASASNGMQYVTNSNYIATSMGSGLGSTGGNIIEDSPNKMNISVTEE